MESGTPFRSSVQSLGKYPLRDCLSCCSIQSAACRSASVVKLSRASLEHVEVKRWNYTSNHGCIMAPLPIHPQESTRLKQSQRRPDNLAFVEALVLMGSQGEIP